MTTSTIERLPVADRAARLGGSRLAELLRLARERDAIDLAIGAPSCPKPPAELVEAACHELRTGHNQYELPTGNPALRAQLARTFPTPADPESELTITVGATEGLAVTLLAMLDPGDEVVVFEPFFENYLGALAITGARPRFVRLNPPHWRYDPVELRRAVGPRTRAILLNTPHNPTGRVLDAAELADIADVCEQWDLTVICDEVYAAFTFDGRRHLSPADMAGLADRTVAIGSLSKSHAVSGWRLGYVRASQRRTQAIRRVHDVVTCGTAGPLQAAAARSGVLPGDWNPAPIMQERRDQAAAILRAMGLRFEPSEGSCYLMADIGGKSDEPAERYVRRVLETAGVLMAPGGLFFTGDRGDRFVRVAFNRPAEVLDKARRWLLPRPCSSALPNTLK